MAAIAGTRGAWITTHQTGNGIGAIRTGLGSRTRGREYRIHPDEIKGLGMASAGLAALLEPDLADQTLLSDREHRAAERAAAQPLASAIMGSDRGDQRGLHRPDLVLIGASGEPMTAIEIELTLKTKARLERILRGYLRNRNLATVRYYAPPQIANAVQRAARATGADALLELASLPQAATPTIWSQR